jgi:hypothetical protein
MQGNITLQGSAAPGCTVWHEWAEAQQLAIEGNLLIAQEIGKRMHGLRRCVMRLLNVG